MIYRIILNRQERGNYRVQDWMEDELKPPTYSYLRNAVGGQCIHVPLPGFANDPGAQMWVNETAKYGDLPQNPLATWLFRVWNPQSKDYIVGDVVILTFNNKVKK